MVMICCRALT